MSYNSDSGVNIHKTTRCEEFALQPTRNACFTVHLRNCIFSSLQQCLTGNVKTKNHSVAMDWLLRKLNLFIIPLPCFQGTMLKFWVDQAKPTNIFVSPPFHVGREAVTGYETQLRQRKVSPAHPLLFLWGSCSAKGVQNYTWTSWHTTTLNPGSPKADQLFPDLLISIYSIY